jgi:catechol 2,3-dioxygenase-like lactoylglutathione lyase family enzyme
MKILRSKIWAIVRLKERADNDRAAMVAARSMSGAGSEQDERVNTILLVITGLAHVAVCVPDVDAVVEWYQTVLGLRVLSPPYRMEGAAIERDMGELVPSPVVVKAAIVGTDDGDHVLELIEYPEVPEGDAPARSVTDRGLTHVGLLCDDIDVVRRDLEAHDVEFLTAGIASVAGVRTTWFRDPWGVVFILVEKRDPGRPYWRQQASP